MTLSEWILNYRLIVNARIFSILQLYVRIYLTACFNITYNGFIFETIEFYIEELSWLLSRYKMHV